MRVGIVGAGAMGSTHAAAWQETAAEIAGFAAENKESAAALAERCGARVYPDLAALIAAVDVVDICTPTHLHHDMVMQCAEAGRHIVCEKPLARTVPQAQAMIRRCREAGVKLLAAHVVRFFPEYAGAKRAVDANAVGQVAVLRFKRNVFRPRKASDNWFLEFEKSGGMILDLMIHDFDVARWIAGDVATVYCQHIADPAISHGDHGLAILTHRSGAISHVEGSWAYPPPTFRTEFEIAGSDGLLLHSSEASAPIVLRSHAAEGDTAGAVPVPRSPLLESPYASEIKAFHDAIAFDAPVPVTAADGLAALQIALAALESARSGRPVQVDPLPEVMA